MSEFLRPDEILNNVYQNGGINTFLRPDEILNLVYSESENALAVNIIGGGGTSNLSVFDTVSSAESTQTNSLIYVKETDTFYKYELNGSSYIVNDTSILNTLNAGNTRYIGVSGKYTEILSIEQLSTKELTGIPTQELSKFTINYNPTNRVLTLTRISDYTFFVQGKQFTKNSTIIMPAHNNTTGLYYYYFDTDGVLKMSLSMPDVFNSVAFVTYIYYNADLIDGFAGDERHGVIMDGDTHKLLHYTFGTQYKTGLNIDGYTLQSDSILDTVYNIEEGTIYDEDIQLTIPELTTDYTIFYKNGILGDWYWNDALSLPYSISNDNIQYNEYTGVTWQLTELNENKFFNSYVCATDIIDTRFKIVIVIGQYLYNTQTEAESRSFADLDLTKFPFTETLPIYQIVHKYDTTYSTTTGKSRFETVIQLFNNRKIVNNNWSIDKIKKYVDNKRDPKIINVAKNGGQFTIINEALNSITDNSMINPYVIKVGTGIYIEDSIIMKDYVSIIGSGEQITIIQALNTTQTIFTGATNCELSSMNITGATGSGGICIKVNNLASTNPFRMSNIYFGSNETQLNVTSTTGITICTLKNSYIGSSSIFTNGFKVDSINASQPSLLVVENFSYLDIIAPFLTTSLFNADGIGAQLVLSSVLTRSSGNTGTAMLIENGASLRILSGTFRGFANGIHCPATGTGQTIIANAINLECFSKDVLIENANTIGNLTGYTSYNKTSINDNCSFFIINKDLKVISVAKRGGDFTSIALALNAITDSTATNRYKVDIGPGIFIEPELTIPSYVSLVGSSINTTVIEPDTNDHNVINMNEMTEISFLTIENAGVGYSAVSSINSGNFTQLHKISIYNSDYGVYFKSTTIDSQLYLEYVDINGIYSEAITCISENGFESYINTENTYTFPDNLNIASNQVLVDGTNAIMRVGNAGVSNVIGNGGIGFLVTNGASLFLKGSSVSNCSKGIYLDTNGINPFIRMTGLTFNDNTINFDISNTTASGEYTGYTEYTKKSINSSNSFFITNKDSNIITVAKKGGDFDSITNAINSITDATDINQYIISIGPGSFIEDTIQMKEYISLSGSGYETIIEPSDSNNHIILGQDHSQISYITVNGCTNNSAIYYSANLSSPNDYFVIEQCLFGNNSTQIEIYSDENPTIIYAKSCELGGNFQFDTFAHIHNNPTHNAIASLRMFQLGSPGGVVAPYPNPFILCEGINADFSVNSCGLIGGGTGNCIQVRNGSQIRLSSVQIINFGTGILCENIGTAPLINATAVTFENCITDINIDHPGTNGSISCSADNSKVFIDENSTIGIQYNENSNDLIGTVTVGDIYQGTRHDRLLNLSKLTTNSSTLGLYSGGTLDVSYSGIDIIVNEGVGFLLNPTDFYIKEVNWITTELAIPDNNESYIYIDTNSDILYSSSLVDLEEYIVLGRVYKNNSNIIFIEETPVKINHYSNENEEYIRDIVGSIYSSGSIVSENISDRKLDITSGSYYYGTNNYLPSGGTNITFLHLYHNSGTWDYVYTDTINNTQYDNGTNLVNLTASYYSKHSLYISSEGLNENYFVIHSQLEYETLLEAQNGTIPTTPTWIKNGITLIASIIVQQGTSSIIEIIDLRPVFNGSASSSSEAVTSHSDLTNLDSDDHLQYLLATGSRVLSGNLDLGNNNITNVNLVDGIDVTSHKSRHDFNGSDPLLSDIALPISDSTNLEGVSNTKVSRYDHVHAHGNRIGGTLHAAVTTSVNGFMIASDKVLLNKLANTRIPISDTNYTITSATDVTVSYVTLTANRTITLPVATNLNQTIIILDELGNCSVDKYLKIVPNGSDTLNGFVYSLIVTSYSRVRLVSNGISNWSFTTEDIQYSTGTIKKPTYTDNNNGSITIGNEGIYNLHKDTTGLDNIYPYIVNGNSFVLTDLTTNYIVINYNSGTHVMQKITDVSLINETTIIPIYTIYREGLRLHTIDWDSLGLSLVNKIHQSIVKTQRYRLEYGLGLSEASTRKVVVEDGKVWIGANGFLLDSFNSNTNEMFFLFHSSNVWDTPSLETDYNNTQYDDGTDLKTLDDGKYAVNFIYRGIEVENECYFVLGQGNYTLLEAQNSIPPANLPHIITSHTMLIGRIIVKKGENTATQIDSIFEAAFRLSPGINHNDTSGIQNAPNSVVGEHYHLSSAQATVVSNTSNTNTGDETAARIGAIVNGATNYTTPLDADKIGIWDTLNSLYKAVTWTNIKATLKTYFDTLYRKLSWNYRASTNANNITTDRDLSDGNIATNISPFIIPVTSSLKRISGFANTTSSATSWVIDILKNGTSVVTLIVTSPTQKAVSTDLNVSFSALDEVRIRVTTITGGNIDSPSVDIYFLEN